MATLLIIALTGIVTFIAFQKPAVMDRLMFRPRAILADKQWERLVTSALIHGDWFHVIFNLITLHSFGQSIEMRYGPYVLLFIYVASIVGGGLLSLVLHRKHEYAALGASGGVCGVMFAAIFLAPGTKVGLFLIPIPIDGKIFALGYLVYTFFAMRKGGDGIGHDAHFGGAAVGLLVSLLIDARKCLQQPYYFFGALVFALGCLVFLNLGFLRELFAGSGAGRGRGGVVPGGRFRDLDENRRRREAQEEIDRILEKISERGMDSLTADERRRLDEMRRGG